MKQRMILYGLTLVLGCFVLASCINDEEGPCLPDSSGKMQVFFTLAVPDNAQTRAPWSENDDNNWENGVGKDNKIDMGSIKLLIFDNENAYIGTVNDLTYIPKNTGDTPYEETVYEFIGTIPVEYNLTNNTTYKFVVLANCTNIPTTITAESLNKLLFSQNTNEIPMWGVTTATLSLVLGKRQDIGDITLLRAMSKVTVQLSQEMINKGFTLKNLQVDNYNSQGYVLPTGAFDVENTINLDQESCVRPLVSAEKNLSGTVNNNSVELYLPEYKNTPEAVTPGEGSDASGDESTTQTIVPATMSVTLKYTEEVEVIGEDGNPTTETFVDEISFPAGIKFINYEKNGAAIAGSDYDIVRNHHYIFTITGAEVGHRLLLTVQTIPWDDERMTVDYTETISWNGSELLTWIPALTEENSYIIDKEGDEYDGFTVFVVNPGDTPTCSFTLNAPQGWRWRAQLEPLTDGADEYITFLDGSLFKEGSVGQQATLNFKIQTGSSTSVQHQSRLRLYVRSGDNSLEVKTLKFIISRNN